MGWFRFKGKDSRDFGILIASVPQRIRPERRVKHIVIPGRNGDLTEDEGVYEPYTITMECSTRGSEKLDEIVAWLNGTGELILSTEPDKVYKASIYNKISISDVVYLYNSFLLQFRVQPLKASVNAFNERIEMEKPSQNGTGKVYQIYNRGTVCSKPTITIYANSDVMLHLNDNLIRLFGVDGHITIDSEMMEAYKDSENANGKVSMTKGFPCFEVGDNSFRVRGVVDKIVIEPKWRWL